MANTRGPFSDNGVIIHDTGMALSDGEGTTQSGERLTVDRGPWPSREREHRLGKKKASEYGKMTFFVNKANVCK